MSMYELSKYFLPAACFLLLAAFFMLLPDLRSCRLAGETASRRLQRAEALLMALATFPYMAHNAAFEDSWFMLHLDGYAEARKAGKIVPIDTRDICRRIDPEVRTLPHDAKPAALETWARRRKTLKANEKEKHLGLEDVDLMFRTVEAEFAERNMFA